MTLALSDRPTTDLSSDSGMPRREEGAVEQLMRPLRPYLLRPDVTELSIVRPGEIFIKCVSGWICEPLDSMTGQYARSLIGAIIAANGLRRRSIMSVILPGNLRGEIVLPPACIEGSFSITIRKHTSTVKSLETLASEGAFADYRDVSFNKPNSDECSILSTRQDFSRLESHEIELLRLKRDGDICTFLEHCVVTKRNIVISGKTGSGKTTFARSLIDKIPTSERLITIEDVHELFLPNHPNRFHIIYGDADGRMRVEDCLRSCLRQSPDRILLAELRGNEAWEYLESLNTGHPGAITTTHANNALHTFARISTLVQKSEVGRLLDLKTIQSVLYSTVDVVLYFHERELKEIYYDPIYAKSHFA